MLNAYLCATVCPAPVSYVCMCVCACVRACVRACVCACVRACARASERVPERTGRYSFTVHWSGRRARSPRCSARAASRARHGSNLRAGVVHLHACLPRAHHAHACMHAHTHTHYMA